MGIWYLMLAAIAALTIGATLLVNHESPGAGLKRGAIIFAGFLLMGMVSLAAKS